MIHGNNTELSEQQYRKNFAYLEQLGEKESRSLLMQSVSQRSKSSQKHLQESPSI